MPSTDGRFKNAYRDIWQHRIRNSDWDDHYLFYRYLELLECEDEIFCKFLENCVHPIVQPNKEQIDKLLLIFNDYLKHDSYILRESQQISGSSVYKVVRLKGGVQGNVKNLIFAASGPKPEIVLADSVSNDIRIVKNEEYCLVYDKPILDRGLLWTDLVEWWGERKNVASFERKDQEIQLYKRLAVSLASPPEKLLFRTYFEQFKKDLGDTLPALIPQVYLHYDPKTISQLQAGQRLIRQRMDFLLLFSNRDRIVLEVDGKQHYSENNVAKPELYAKMVAEDRRMRLNGYEIYRFGGYELSGERGKKVVTDFFIVLFQHHSVRK